MNCQAMSQTKPISSIMPVLTTMFTGLLQRACACGGTPGPTGECEACRKNRKVAMLQRAANHAAVTASAPPIVDDVLRSPGQPLDATTRADLEPRFGRDFSDVRIHTDPQAAASARAVDALAYTVGNKIVFGAGKYAPTSTAGQRLLAHELTHVIQQVGSAPAETLTIPPPDTSQEHEAIAAGEQLGCTPLRQPTSTRFLLQRQPVQNALRNQICFQSGQAPQEQAGGCDVSEPANCPTYELWVNAFRRLRTFAGRDTAAGGSEETGFDVLGQAATRPIDNPNAPADELPAPAVRPQVADRFVDHPTDQWVRTCLPPNLRETAYRLSTDCADIAVILRHIWLSAHRRTEQYGGWLVGDQAGGARRQAIGGIIGQVFSGNVARTLNAYSDANGQPLRTFDELQALLHPGDVLVWEHHSGGLGTARTGGDTQTIMRIERRGGRITRIEVVQGNQPISEPQSDEIRAAIGRRAPSEETLRNAPGRRIEVHQLSGSSLRDLPLPARRGQAASSLPTRLWTQSDGHTTLVAAGPAQAARRPAARTLQGQRVRRISDWHAPLRSATSVTLDGIVEAALLELRALIEGGQTGLEAEATTLGQVAGERLWQLARHAGGLGDESHFRPLQRLRSVIQALGNQTGQRGFASDATPQAANVRRIFGLVDDAFHVTARGATTINFQRRTPAGTTQVRVLVTGFDPFASSGTVPSGVINPSGAAALALDNTTVTAGRGISAAVESVVLPVDFGDFRRGLVENIVRPLVQSRGVDAILTVSLDESIGSTSPVRLERFVVGVHSEQGQLGAVPAAQGSLGPAIIETPAPVDAIAIETAQTGRRGAPSIPKPTVRNDVTLRFHSSALADRALTALSLPPAGSGEVTISDLTALRQIISTMQRASNGVELTFRAGNQSFNATVLRGPGGDFLSNEVSFRILRLLAEQQRLDITSFHIHVPRALPNEGDRIPQDTRTAEARTSRRQAIRSATGLRDRLVATLRSMIRAVAIRVAAQLNPSGSPPRQP